MTARALGGSRPIRALVTDWEFEDLEIERMILADADIEFAEAQCRTPDEVIAAAREAGAHALVVQYAPITERVLREVPDLGIVTRYGVGVDTIDLDAAAEAGVMVCNATSYGDEEVATHASALALSLVRGIAFHDRDVRAGGWDYKLARPLRRVGHLTLGVLGLGRIGRLTAQRLSPFFANVIGCDPYAAEAEWPQDVERVDHDDLLARSDLLTIHVPLTDETRHLVDDRAVDRLPAGAMVVNTARGAVVDDAALLRGLERGHLSGVGLDVLEHEPAPAEHPLRRHPRALITPHAAFYSAESEIILRSKTVGNVVAWAAGRRPDDVMVDPG